MLMDNYSQQPMSNLPPTPPAQINPVQPGRVPVQAQVAKTKTDSKKIFIIVIILLSVAFIAALVAFILFFAKYNEAKTDLDEKISVAVAKAKDEQAEALEKEFAEREKDPYKEFVGPEDYGSLGFKYPRTWSVYIDSDASKGGDFKAFLNPNEVSSNPDSATTTNALRVQIVNRSTEAVKADYQKAVSAKDSKLSAEEITINDVNATHYYGIIPGTELSGHVVLFKIRDKTAILRTDSDLFVDDFNDVLNSVTFNE